MASKFQVLLAGAGLLACAVTIAAEHPFEMASDPEGRNFIVENQGTKNNPVLVTKRVGPDKSTYYMKRSIDCKNWKVRNLGWGPTIEAMNKQEGEAESSPIEAGSIPDHYARYACPPPHPGPKP